MAHEQRFRYHVRAECGWISRFRTDEGERLDDLLDNHSNLDAFYAQLLASGRRAQGSINMVVSLTRGQGQSIESMHFSEVGEPEPREEEAETYTFLDIMTSGRSWRQYREDARIPLPDLESYNSLERTHRAMGTALAAQMRDMSSWRGIPWEFYRELGGALRSASRGPQNIDARVELHADVTVRRGAGGVPHFTVNRISWQAYARAIAGELPPGPSGEQLAWAQMREDARNQLMSVAWQAGVGTPNPVGDITQFIGAFAELRNQRYYWIRVRAFSEQLAYAEGVDRSEEEGAEGSAHRRSYVVGRQLGLTARGVVYPRMWTQIQARWGQAYGGSPQHTYLQQMRGSGSLRREVIASAISRRYSSDRDRAALYRALVANEPEYD